MANVLFLNRNFVFTVMIYNILKKLCFVSFCKFARSEDGVLKIHFACLTKNSVFFFIYMKQS